MQIFGRDRLVVRDVRPEEHDEVRVQPVDIAARGRAKAKRLLHRGGRRRVTEPRGVIHVVGPEKACGLLGRVVHLVGDPARRQVERCALRVDRAQTVRDAIECLVPPDDPESALAPPANQRLRQTTKRAQVARRAAGERRDVLEDANVERRRRVETQELEAHHAEMRTRNRPVLETRRPERAAVADPVSQDAPGKGQLRAVLPCHAHHFPIVMRLLPPETKHLGCPTSGCAPRARRC